MWSEYEGDGGSVRITSPLIVTPLSDRLVPRRSDVTAAIVGTIPRNVDDAAARFVGCPIELAHREVDPSADRRAVGKCARRLDEVIAEQTRRLIIADHHPIDYDIL